MNTELIRLKEVSKNIGLSTTTLRRMIKRGELKGVIIGGNYYVRPNDYYEFIYNVECKKLDVTPEQMRKMYEEVQKEKNQQLFELFGINRLPKATQEFVLRAMSCIR